MKKSPLIFILIFVSVVAAAATYLFIQKDDTGSIVRTNQTTPTSVASTQPQQATTTPASGAGYVAYSEDSLSTTAGDKVLFFHAPWCWQCREIEKGINEQGVPAGLTIFKVDYDTHQDLRKKYGVTLQTTFVKVDDKGNKLESYVAYDEPTFDAVKRNFLK